MFQEFGPGIFGGVEVIEFLPVDQDLADITVQVQDCAEKDVGIYDDLIHRVRSLL